MNIKYMVLVLFIAVSGCFASEVPSIVRQDIMQEELSWLKEKENDLFAGLMDEEDPHMKEALKDLYIDHLDRKIYQLQTEGSFSEIRALNELKQIVERFRTLGDFKEYLQRTLAKSY